MCAQGRKADAGHDRKLGIHANHESTCADPDAFLPESEFQV